MERFKKEIHYESSTKLGEKGIVKKKNGKTKKPALSRRAISLTYQTNANPRVMRNLLINFDLLKPVWKDNHASPILVSPAKDL